MSELRRCSRLMVLGERLSTVAMSRVVELEQTGHGDAVFGL